MLLASKLKIRPVFRCYFSTFRFGHIVVELHEAKAAGLRFPEVLCLLAMFAVALQAYGRRCTQPLEPRRKIKLPRRPTPNDMDLERHAFEHLEA